MKTRNQAAKILSDNAWSFEEIESVLIKKIAKVSKKSTATKPKNKLK
jgi:hypothetical protein